MELKVDGRYLVKMGLSGPITELTVIEITERAIKVKYESGFTHWFLKDGEVKHWEVIEEIKREIIHYFKFE